MYIWNPEKWHWLTYLQGRKRDTDREHVGGHYMGGESRVETQYMTISKMLTDS